MLIRLTKAKITDRHKEMFYLSVWLLDYPKSYERILVKFFGGMESGHSLASVAMLAKRAT